MDNPSSAYQFRRVDFGSDCFKVLVHYDFFFAISLLSQIGYAIQHQHTDTKTSITGQAALEGTIAQFIGCEHYLAGSQMLMVLARLQVHNGLLRRIEWKDIYRETRLPVDEIGAA